MIAAGGIAVATDGALGSGDRGRGGAAVLGAVVRVRGADPAAVPVLRRCRALAGQQAEAMVAMAIAPMITHSEAIVPISGT